MKRRKRRAHTAPDSYHSMIYISQERQFDFGPLLIGKNPEDRNTEEMKIRNSSTFRITNNGSFEANVKFYFSSDVKAEQPEFEKDFKKGVFFLEPEEMTLGIDETKEIRVWAIPDEVKSFREELICVVRDNPIPEIF